MPRQPEIGFVVITLNGITAMGYHGVLDSERKLGQPFSVDLRVKAIEPEGDDLANAVDYAQLAQLTTDRIQAGPVNLIESLAVEIADAIIQLPRVQDVTVTVHKPRAPIPVPFDDVSVTVRRAQV